MPEVSKTLWILVRILLELCGSDILVLNCSFNILNSSQGWGGSPQPCAITNTGTTIQRHTVSFLTILNGFVLKSIMFCLLLAWGTASLTKLTQTLERSNRLLEHRLFGIQPNHNLPFSLPTSGCSTRSHPAHNCCGTPRVS